MAKNKSSLARKMPRAPEPEPEPDEPEETPGTEDGETDYEFDDSYIPQGLELEELRPSFEPVVGFLMVPRVNKKTGEITPRTATFAGILQDVVPWVDNRGKERLWFACKATTEVADCSYVDNDGEEDTVSKGDRVGISGTGAINALKDKKGHFVYLHWTGNKVSVKNGMMWEVKAKVSKKPVDPDNV